MDASISNIRIIRCAYRICARLYAHELSRVLITGNTGYSVVLNRLRPQTVTNSAAGVESKPECRKMTVEEAVNPCDNVKEGNNGSSVPF